MATAPSQAESDLQRRVAAEFESIPYFELRTIAVAETVDGLVLQGRVSTFYYKQLAQRQALAAATPCSRRVVNLIEVDETVFK